MVKLTLPLHYEVYAKPYRHRDASHVHLVDFVSVDVREVPECDAPEVLTLHAMDAEERVRWHDGRFWMVDEIDGPATKSLRRMVGGFPGEHDRNPSYFQTRHWRYKIPSNGMVVGKTVESERCREVTGSDRDASLVDLHLKADGELLSIGGVLHVCVPEPFIVIGKKEVRLRLGKRSGIGEDGETHFRGVFFGNPREQGHFLYSHYGSPEVRQEFLCYSLEQAEEADYAEAYLVGCGIEVERTGTMEALANHAVAEYSTIRTEEADLMKAATSTLNDARYEMSDWPTQDAMKWFALRDAVRPEQAEASPDEVLDALLDLSRVYDCDPWTKLQAERWRMRPVTANLAFR